MLIDDVLGRHRDALGPHYDRYRGHAHRVYHYTRHLIGRAGGDPDEDDLSIAVAAAFHDLCFAKDQILDYLPPSTAAAQHYLAEIGAGQRGERVSLMIGMHHKLTPYRDAHAQWVEPFRRADLVDLFAVPGVGVPMALRRQTQATHPVCGFRGFVCRTLLIGAIKHPLRPLPMLRL